MRFVMVVMVVVSMFGFNNGMAASSPTNVTSVNVPVGCLEGNGREVESNGYKYRCELVERGADVYHAYEGLFSGKDIFSAERVQVTTKTEKLGFVTPHTTLVSQSPIVTKQPDKEMPGVAAVYRDVKEEVVRTPKQQWKYKVSSKK